METVENWLPALVQLGLAVCLVLFFVWRDWKKDQRLENERTETEQFIRNILIATVEKNTAAMQKIFSYLERTL